VATEPSAPQPSHHLAIYAKPTFDAVVEATARLDPARRRLEEVLEAYLATRRDRFKHHDPPLPSFVGVRGQGLSVDQVST
jgi:hypothetical protein